MANPALRSSLVGDVGVQRALAAIGEEMREKAVPVALRAAGRVVVTKARALAPVESGLLKKSLGLVLRGRRRRPRYVVLGARREVSGTGPDGRKRVPAYYAHLVEFGHATVKPRKGTSLRQGTATAVGFVPAKPFLRPALHGSRAEVASKFVETLSTAQARIAARAAKKTKR